MLTQQSMRDIIVVIPGIMGSALAIDEPDNEVWGLSRQAIIGNLFSLGRNLERLKLPEGIGDDDPKDGVIATRLMPDLHLIPGFWSIDGYGQMVTDLRERFTLSQPSEGQPGNFIPFPYDWRLSNVVSAKRLKRVVEPALERWRKQTKNPEAKLILICHSMGGLVARWFVEVEGGREITRYLITIGTPYRGSINALEYLVNGYSLGLGPLKRDLTELVRSFPSAYQLLPTYDCLNLGDGKFRKLTEVDIPGVTTENVRRATVFHETIAKHVDPGRGGYEIMAMKGHIQPTAQSAVLSNGRIEPRNEHKGTDYAGDGRVPRPSAHPPEWSGDTNAVFFAQKHESLQNTKGVLHQLHGRLTGHLGIFMGGERIGVEAPEFVGVGEPIRVTARAEDEDETLALQVTAQSEDGTEVGPDLMRNEGHGLYMATLANLAPGAHRVRVESAVLQRAVDPVTNITLVWDDAVAA